MFEKISSLLKELHYQDASIHPEDRLSKLNEFLFLIQKLVKDDVIRKEKDQELAESMISGCEDAIRHGHWEIARDLAELADAQSLPMNQLRCRFFLCKAQLMAPRRPATKISVLEQSLAMIKASIDYAESRREQYEFLIHNSTVIYWQIVKPSWKPGFKKHLAPSLMHSTNAAWNMTHPNWDWLAVLLTHLVEALVEAEDRDQASAYIKKAMDMSSNQAPHLFHKIYGMMVEFGLSVDEDSDRSLESLERMSIDSIVGNTKKIGQFVSGKMHSIKRLVKELNRERRFCQEEVDKNIRPMLDSIIKVISSEKKYRDTKEGRGKGKGRKTQGRGSSFSMKRQSTLMSKIASTVGGMARRESTVSGRSGSKMSISKRELVMYSFYIQPLLPPAGESPLEKERLLIRELLLETGFLCCSVRCMDLARTCLLLEQENSGRERTVEFELLECQILSLELADSKWTVHRDSYVMRRVEVLARAVEIANLAQRAGSIAMIQSSAINIWNCGLPLLQAGCRKLCFRPFLRAAELLNTQDQPMARPLALINWEIAKCEEEADHIESAMVYLREALKYRDHCSYGHSIEEHLRRLECKRDSKSHNEDPKLKAFTMVEHFAANSSGAGVTPFLIQAGNLLTDGQLSRMVDGERVALQALFDAKQMSEVWLAKVAALHTVLVLQKVKSIQFTGTSNTEEYVSVWWYLARAAAKTGFLSLQRLSSLLCIGSEPADFIGEKNTDPVSIPKSHLDIQGEYTFDQLSLRQHKREIIRMMADMHMMAAQSIYNLLKTCGSSVRVEPDLFSKWEPASKTNTDSEVRKKPTSLSHAMTRVVGEIDR